jgi:hypothetical protein
MGEIHGRPAFQVFMESQKNIHAPYAVIFQWEHSQLAGALASALGEEPFGVLDPEVVEAARDHDFGWQASDAQQMGSLGEVGLRPFLSVRLEETLMAWERCIRHAGSVSPLMEVLVSRHFTLLGRGDPQRAEFVQSETARRESMEKRLPFGRGDLDRWTAAIGFCDLVSLYLCSGSRETVELRLAHPADPNAAEAPKVRLAWENGSPCFSRPMLKPGTPLSLDVRAYEGDGANTRPLSLAWSFPRG